MLHMLGVGATMGQEALLAEGPQMAVEMIEPRLFLTAHHGAAAPLHQLGQKFRQRLVNTGVFQMIEPQLGHVAS